MNGIKTTLLLGLLSGFLLVGGRALGGERGLFYGLVLAIGMNFFSYFFSEKMALMSSRAQRVSETRISGDLQAARAAGAAFGGAHGNSYAETLGDAGPFSECVRYRAESRACFGGRDVGNFANHERPRIIGGARTRTRARKESGYPDQLDRRDLGFRDHISGANGDVVRRQQRRQGPARAAIPSPCC